MKKLGILYFLTLVSSVLTAQTVTLVGTLPDTVKETSGLILYNGKLITHNDSGNSTELFEIDTLSLMVTRVVSVTNAENVDWEDIAQDDNYIYVADIGNFNGDRTDLAIYRISKQDYDSSDSVAAERISFSYEDQMNFDRMPNSDWDAEAITIIRGQLTLFTKQWQSNGTVAYAIPDTPGEHIAVNIGSSDVGGLITGATYNESSNILYLLGYSQQLLPFLRRFVDPPGPISFGGTGDFINLGIGFAQTEAITFIDHNSYYISSEEFINTSPPISLAPSLYRLETDDMIDEPDPDPGPDPGPDPDPDPDPDEDGEDLILFRQIGSPILHYELNVDDDLFGRAIFDITGKLIQFTPEEDIESNEIDISSYGNSVYFLTFYFRKKTVVKAFITN